MNTRSGMRLGCALLLTAMLASCGYRSVISPGTRAVESNERFAPFLVRNVTADLGATHVVGTAALQELGRRDRLGTRDGDGLYEVRITIRRVGQRAVAFAPNGSIIEYLGDLVFDYTVYAPGGTSPLAVVTSEPLWYRYHANPNPHILQQYRDAALTEAVRGWVPKLLMHTSVLAERQRQAPPEEGQSVDPNTEESAAEHHREDVDNEAEGV